MADATAPHPSVRAPWTPPLPVSRHFWFFPTPRKDRKWQLSGRWRAF